MTMSEEGLSRLKAMENQAYYLFTLLEEIQDKEDILPQEYRYLENANEIFDTILYGAGYFEDEYLHDHSLNLNDYYILFSYAKEILKNKVKTMEDLKNEFDLYRKLIDSVRDEKAAPDSGHDQDIYTSIKDFFMKYYEALSDSSDYAVVEI